MAYLTKDGKARFVRQLVASVERDVLEAIDKMPDDWDGFELRQYLADKFADAAYTRMDRKRAASFKNEVIVRNL